jgi:hypothetical protein
MYLGIVLLFINENIESQPTYKLCTGGVGIATRLQPGRSGFRTPGGKIYISVFKKSRPTLGFHPASWFDGYWDSFPRIKRPERDIDHLPPSTADVKIEWSYASTPPICLHGVKRDSIPFTT